MAKEKKRGFFSWLGFGQKEQAQETETEQKVEEQQAVADEALVYVESEVENGLPPVPANWHLYREKVAGQVAYRLYQREAQGENHAD